LGGDRSARDTAATEWHIPSSAASVRRPMKFAAILWGMVMFASVMARGAELGTVEDRSFSISGFRLQNGTVMPQVKIAYETYGPFTSSRQGEFVL
jgi:hypothetical protein